MPENKLELTDEILQRYSDGDLEAGQRSQVEQALALSPEHCRTLGRYRELNRLLDVCSECEPPDELTVQRNWDAIELAMARPARTVYRRSLPWLSFAAAAAIAAFVFGPFQSARSAEAEVVSIDCTYPSFMLLSPDQNGTHTIIWVNDSAR